MIFLRTREEDSKLMLWLSPFLAVFVMLIFGGIVLALLGLPILRGLSIFFIEPLSSWRGISELLLKSIPLALCGMGLAFGFKGGVWNIGAEGQLAVGALAASFVALLFYDMEGWYILPLVLLSGVWGGILWGMIPALLKIWSGASEILTSLMLAYVGGLPLRARGHGPLKEPDGDNFPVTSLFSDGA